MFNMLIKNIEDRKFLCQCLIEDPLKESGSIQATSMYDVDNEQIWIIYQNTGIEKIENKNNILIPLFFYKEINDYKIVEHNFIECLKASSLENNTFNNLENCLSYFNKINLLPVKMICHKDNKFFKLNGRVNKSSNIIGSHLFCYNKKDIGFEVLHHPEITLDTCYILPDQEYLGVMPFIETYSQVGIGLIGNHIAVLKT